jgi:hypothetical protein
VPAENVADDLAVIDDDGHCEANWLVSNIRIGGRRFLEVTQQAKHELLRRRSELGGSNGHILGLEVDESSCVQVEPRVPGAADVVLHDGDNELVFVERRLYARLADCILHFSYADDGLQCSRGWVLLKPRGERARADLADSVREPEAEREPAGLRRFVRSVAAAMHPIIGSSRNPQSA